MTWILQVDLLKTKSWYASKQILQTFLFTEDFIWSVLSRSKQTPLHWLLNLNLFRPITTWFVPWSGVPHWETLSRDQGETLSPNQVRPTVHWNLGTLELGTHFRDSLGDYLERWCGVQKICFLLFHIFQSMDLKNGNLVLGTLEMHFGNFGPLLGRRVNFGTYILNLARVTGPAQGPAVAVQLSRTTSISPVRIKQNLG